MEQKVTIEGKEYTLKEMPYLEALDIKVDDPKAGITKTLKACAGLTDEEIANLTVKEGIQLQKAINELNGLDNFQEAIDNQQ